jgi:transcriptional regulator with XRE-family HTH domain
MASKKTTKNFAEVIRAELAADPGLAKEIEQERLHADIAEQILRLRTEARLTQKELAALVGTKQSVISRIEDADYYGHSLAILERIASVCRKRLFVVFCALDCTPNLYGRAAVATNTTAQVTYDPSGWNQMMATTRFSLAIPPTQTMPLSGQFLGPSQLTSICK